MINEKKHQNRFRGIVVQPYDLFVRISSYRFPRSIVCVFILTSASTQRIMLITM